MSENQVLIREMSLGGRTLKLETGRLAKQASGAVLATYGETVVLVTATVAKNTRDIDFFPLTVDYEEKLYAVGRIPGGFIKRESRPTEKAILSGRLIDRPIRPLFPQHMRNEVQVVATILSVDQDNAPEITAMIGASAALHISKIPLSKPIGGVIVGRVDGQFVLNPVVRQEQNSDVHLVVAGTDDAVMMVEAGAKEVPEDQMLDAIIFGHEQVKEIVKFIEDFRTDALAMGLAWEKMDIPAPEFDEVMANKILPRAEEKIREAVLYCSAENLSKKQREAYMYEVMSGLQEGFLDQFPDNAKEIMALIEKAEKKVVRRIITHDKLRIDGRAIDEIRPISVEVGVLPRTHGSGLFTRGQTQILSVATLGSISEEQILDGLGTEETKRYLHHYNFPPFSTGETKPMRSPGRREIGHGALAARALEPMIPPEEIFPYTIRVVSEAIESNGSTSMGSVCGSTLSLMDAGVPIKAPVAGVAMGLVMEEDQFTVLTDIQGLEDHLGDMDFKVAGSANGVTALQMDIKIPGITKEVFEQALEQAHRGRMYILKKMLDVLPSTRPEISEHAPSIIRTNINPDKIRDVIGPGGKIIKRLVEETGADIDIEDDGRVFISAIDREKGKRALEIIQSITADVEVGKLYDGKVTRVTDFGCFVEVIPGVLGLSGKEGLVHISQLDFQRVEKTEDIVKEGEIITVKAIGYDPQGRLKLSKKEAMRDMGLAPAPQGGKAEQPERGERRPFSRPRTTKE